MCKMSSIIKFELLQKHEELHDEMLQLQEEIDILNLLLKKVQSEYFEVDSKIRKNQHLDKVKMVKLR